MFKPNQPSTLSKIDVNRPVRPPTLTRRTMLRHTSAACIGGLGLFAIGLGACSGSSGSSGGQSSTSTGGSNTGSVATPTPPGLSLGGNLTPVHDPSMVFADGTYHLFSTSHQDEAPGLIHWRTSTDKEQWSLHGAVFDAMPDWAKTDYPESTGIWAPDVVHINNEYRIYYSVSSFGKNTSAIGLVTTPSLTPQNGQAVVWTDKGIVTKSIASDDYNAIDAAVYLDARGRCWMSFGSFWSGIKQIELDPINGMALHNSTDLHALAARPDHNVGAIEAPYIIYRSAYYYLFVSFDFCCRGADSTYRTLVGRSRDPQGPFVDDTSKSMMDGGGKAFLQADFDSSRRYVGTGHMAVWADPDAHYALYHAYDTQNNGTPTLRIQQIDWQDDWPVAI